MLAFCSKKELHGPHNAGLEQDVCYNLKGFILVHSMPLGSWQETGAAVGGGLLSWGSEVRYSLHRTLGETGPVANRD